MLVNRYMLLADYDAYIKCQEKVSATYAVSIVVSAFSVLQYVGITMFPSRAHTLYTAIGFRVKG